MHLLPALLLEPPLHEPQALDLLPIELWWSGGRVGVTLRPDGNDAPASYAGLGIGAPPLNGMSK